VLAIPGSKTAAHVAENAAAGDIALTDEELGMLDRAFRHGVAAGERYPELQLSRVER